MKKSKNIKKVKKPWIAGILNLIVPGFGYYYIGEKGYFTFALVVISIVLLFMNLPVIKIPGRIEVQDFQILYGLFFAYDAYRKAKGKK
ncbi:MAG: hypothetical protein ISS48_02130 [Candidatus Aenigmarchaeota archaeon]|nr:hypothetical protein [Candidatus Aenigmarchaeota archaeon]